MASTALLASDGLVPAHFGFSTELTRKGQPESHRPWTGAQMVPRLCGLPRNRMEALGTHKQPESQGKSTQGRVLPSVLGTLHQWVRFPCASAVKPPLSVRFLLLPIFRCPTVGDLAVKSPLIGGLGSSACSVACRHRHVARAPCSPLAKHPASRGRTEDVAKLVSPSSRRSTLNDSSRRSPHGQDLHRVMSAGNPSFSCRTR